MAHGRHDTNGNGYRVGAPVETTERRVGELGALIIDPTTDQVSHLVVWDGAAAVRRMVPVELVASPLEQPTRRSGARVTLMRNSFRALRSASRFASCAPARTTSTSTPMCWR